MTTITLNNLADGVSVGFNTTGDESDFDRGVECAAEMESISISLSRTWGGQSKCGGSVTSYEKIGYHRGSVGFMRGVLSTGFKVKVACLDRFDDLVWKDLVE